MPIVAIYCFNILLWRKVSIAQAAEKIKQKN